MFHNLPQPWRVCSLWDRHWSCDQEYFQASRSRSPEHKVDFSTFPTYRWGQGNAICFQGLCLEAARIWNAIFSTFYWSFAEFIPLDWSSRRCPGRNHFHRRWTWPHTLLEKECIVLFLFCRYVWWESYIFMCDIVNIFWYLNATKPLFSAFPLLVPELNLKYSKVAIL